MNGNYGKTGMILLLCCYMWQGIAQEPEFRQAKLPVVAGDHLIQSERDLQASVNLFSFADYLTMEVKVKDDFLNNNPSRVTSDHIELYLALPLEAFPDGFESTVHPYYLYAPAMALRGGGEPQAPRFFSSESQKLKAMEVGPFLSHSAYPEKNEIRQDSFEIPLATHLLRKRVDYGIVHFGLFPDQRKAHVYNKRFHNLLETELDIELGDLASGISYVVDRFEDGYMYTIQISPRALGFVQLPSMDKIRLSLDVFDSDKDHLKEVSILSLKGDGSRSLKNRSFKTISLSRPLKTNFSETPDRVFNQTSYFPTYTYAEQGWIPTALEIDALFYKHQLASESLSEIRFTHRPQSYKQISYPEKYITVEQLSVDYEFVNLLDKRITYTLLNGQVFQSQLTLPQEEDSLSMPETQLFFFPDGHPGLILLESAAMNPYGWGDRGTLLNERIRVLHVNRQEAEEVLRIEQGDSEWPYCHVADESYPGYFVENINWAQEGTIMVLQLKHRTDQGRKRLRVSWDEDGSDIEIQELP